MLLDHPPLAVAPSTNSDFSELDKALQQVRCSMEGASQPSIASKKSGVATNPMLKRHHSLPHGQESRSTDSNGSHINAPISSRTRRALQNKSSPSNRYETPNEEEELLSEALASTHKAAKKLDSQQQAVAEASQKKSLQQSQPDMGASSYLTPSPSANRNGVNFSQNAYTTPTKPLVISKSRTTGDDGPAKWPTPPYDDNDWASSVAASLMATQSMYR
jgi:meiosis induction protein kinase IME2/SME1